jgi:hypothetical protein
VAARATTDFLQFRASTVSPVKDWRCAA